MKKDDVDRDTESLDSFKRGRGRPAGDVQALTAAQRQKARRDRLKGLGTGFLTVELPVDVLTALDAFVRFKDTSKGEVVERALRNQLMRKR